MRARVGVRAPRWLLVLSLLGVGCGGARVEAREPESGEGVAGEAAGLRLLAVERPTEGLVWLALWIDAGSRDAQPPQVAALAAWAVAPRGVEARTLPDGIELSRPCGADALAECLTELARALSARDVGSQSLEVARARLEEAREHAAADRDRAADGLAIEALLGGPIDPLGRREDDAGAGSEEVRAFLADHFGARRALLVAVGDVDADRLRDAAARAFAGIPRARTPRASRRLDPHRAVRVAVGDGDLVSLASARPTADDAARVARRLIARVSADLPSLPAAEVFPLRGGAVLIVRARGQTARTSQALLEAYSGLDEEPRVSTPARPEDGPVALARWLGAGWVTRASTTDEAWEGGLGLGALVDGGRGDDTAREDPDAPLREATEGTLTTALERAGEPIALEGDADRERVDARAGEGGARIMGARVPGASTVGVTILFAGGPSLESASEHGLSALLARAAAIGCDAVALRELGTGLDGTGIDVSAVVELDAWGLSFIAPRERWAELAHLAPRCAELPGLGPDLLEAARDTVLATIAERGELRAQIARSLSSSSPGRVALFGSRGSARGATLRALRRWRRSHVVGSRARIGIAGDVEIDRAARVVARRVRGWPVGTESEPLPWAPASEPVRSVPREEGLRAVLGWVVEGPEHAESARAFAAAVARALAAEPGIEPTWSDGGALAGSAWAAIEVRLDAEALDALPNRVARAVRAIGYAWPELAERATAEAAGQRGWAAASPRGLATTLARGAPAAVGSEAALTLLRRLAETPPHVVIARPQPGRGH